MVAAVVLKSALKILQVAPKSTYIEEIVPKKNKCYALVSVVIQITAPKMCVYVK